MGTWLERARAEISKDPNQGDGNTAVRKSNGTIGSTPSPHFLKIQAESGLIFPKTATRGTAVTADRNPDGGSASTVSRRRRLSALSCARLRSPSWRA